MTTSQQNILSVIILKQVEMFINKNTISTTSTLQKTSAADEAELRSNVYTLHTVIVTIQSHSLKAKNQPFIT